MKTELTTMKVSELSPNEYNPRTISKEEMSNLKKSLKKFGVVENIVWNKRTRNVVGGNQRIVALKALRVKEVPVIVVDLPEDEEKALGMALNRISGDWDIPKLKEIIENLDIPLLDFTGFGGDELKGLLEGVNPDAPVITDEETPEAEDRTPEEENPGAHEETGTSIAPPPPAYEGAKFVIYLTFTSKEKADTWLLKNFNDINGIRAGKKTKVIKMEA